MRLVPYTDEYKNGVRSCLKRNVPWMLKISDEQLYKWLLPIIDYPWINQISSEKYPYKAGIVLLDDNDNVRGFSAVIHSMQTIDGREQIVVSPSTTVVDKEHKFYFFDMCDEMFKYGDVFYDFSPNVAAQTTSRDLFGFTLIDNPMYMMRPIIARRKGFELDSQIKDEECQRILNDHRLYGVKCVRIFNDREETYVFYKIISKIKGLPLKTLCVLEVTNKRFFVDNFRICVSLLTRKEHSCFMADSRFVDENNLPKLCVKKQKYRAILNQSDLTNYSFMYSELALLKNEMV